MDAGEVREEDAFDVAALHAWLAGRMAGLDGPPQVRQFRGGVSNLTYLLRYADRDLVMRRPPRGRKAASAHDMRREFTVQQRLKPHFGAVPQMLAFCDDPSVLGDEFYVMEHVEGTVLRSELPPGTTLGPDEARALGHTVVDTLAALHTVDPEAAGLAELGKGPGYVRRQVEGWSRRYRGALTDDVPGGEAVMAWLDEHRPEDAALRLIHNDWKLDNLILDMSGPARIVGVLDWEMATVGDPLMELGSAMAYWITADDDELYALLRRQPTHLPGMPTREQFVARYLERTGLKMGDWTFYEVFGLFRLAVIAQQIWFRYRAGQTTNPAFAMFGDAVRILVGRASAKAGVRA
ncbi:phosphotransferase family protein [Planomonospora alba]|uniref:Phosphotransferase family protein n=1 Tax=Planomonospora alba TaxID=161354 RepID=A0ABP6MR03_9ACTN